MKIESFLLFLLLLSGCCTGVDNLRHNIPITYSLQNAEISLGNSFDLELFVPNMLETIDGIEADVSDVDFGFRIQFFNYVEDENLNFWEFPEADNDFEILQADLRDEFDFFRNFEQLNNGRRLTLRITPNQEGIYFLSVTSRGGIDASVSTCAPFHEMSTRNDDLPIAQNFPNIDENLSNFYFGQEEQGLFLFSVN